jgi:hypothetical protein
MDILLLAPDGLALAPSLASSPACSRQGLGGGRMLEDTQRQCRQEFVRALRSYEWCQCWLLPPWRQQSAFVLCVSTAQLMGAVSRQRPGLLRYVPEFYVTCCLDMVGGQAGLGAVGWGGLAAGCGMCQCILPALLCFALLAPSAASTACRRQRSTVSVLAASCLRRRHCCQVHAIHRSEPAVLDHKSMLGLGLRAIVAFVVTHLEDEQASCGRLAAAMYAASCPLIGAVPPHHGGPAPMPCVFFLSYSLIRCPV